MTFAINDDQRAMDAGLTPFLARLAADGSPDWQAAIEAFGLEGLGRSVETGGLGTGTREAAIVARALGQAGICLPWAEHWVAARLDAFVADAGPLATSAAHVTNQARQQQRSGWAEDALAIVHCAEMSGLCETLLADTVAFSKERRQFGVTIASFQVLRHRMVDMRLALEQAIAMAGYAIDLIDHDDDEARRKAVSAARVLCEDAIRIVGGGAVQIHGAMGLTEELRIGRLFRRASSLAQGDGTGRAHLRRYAGLMVS